MEAVSKRVDICWITLCFVFECLNLYFSRILRSRKWSLIFSLFSAEDLNLAATNSCLVSSRIVQVFCHFSAAGSFWQLHGTRFVGEFRILRLHFWFSFIFWRNDISSLVLRVPSKKVLQFCSLPQALHIWPSSKRVPCILWIFSDILRYFSHYFICASIRRWNICRPSSCRIGCRMRTERTTAKHAAHSVYKKALLACFVMISVAAKSTHSSASLLISFPLFRLRCWDLAFG